jgi:hypothetical protein
MPSDATPTQPEADQLKLLAHGELDPNIPLRPQYRDIPYLSGVGEVGETLNCTMGNWTGEPTSYAYVWVSVAPDGKKPKPPAPENEYIVVSTDAGNSIECVVIATNAGGSSAAPPSNAILIAPEIAR